MNTLFLEDIGIGVIVFCILCFVVGIAKIFPAILKHRANTLKSKTRENNFETEIPGEFISH